MQNQRAYMNELGNKLNIKDQAGWYNVTIKDFLENKGAGLLGEYNHNMTNLLQSVYPQYPTNIWHGDYK
jgi:hypothetical protein